MGLKESLIELQEKERLNKKLSLKREINKELNRIKKEKSSLKKCINCNKNIAKYYIKGTLEFYCKDCAKELFGKLGYLSKLI